MPFLLPAIPIIAGAIASAGTALAVGVETAVLALGVSGATALTIGTFVEAAVPAVIEFGALAGASALLTPKPKINTSGSPQSFKADPYAPVPFVMGRYGVSGNLVYETTTGGSSKAEHGAAGNEFLTQFVVLSAGGPIEGFETLRLDNTILTFNGQNCTGGYIESEYVQSYNPGYSQNTNGSYANNVYGDHIWQYTQTGTPNGGGMGYPAKINNSNDRIPEWTAAFGLSYLAAAAITRSYDTTVWTGGPGTPQWTIKGYRVYDPRLDSSYAGGSGPQRWPGHSTDRRDFYAAARATWAWSENPIIHALNYALGHYLPDPSTGSAASDIACGRLYAGCGAGFGGVDVEAFIRAANNADANGWRVCGQWTTGDGKRSVLTAMLQAGGAQLASDRGRISCTFSAPVAAVNANAPLTWADLAGAPSLDTTIGTRDRTNTAFYSYSSEAHRWQVVQADTPVQAATYVGEDGGIVRSKKLTFEYVPSVNQAAQLAAYAIVDGRELPNIVLPGKPHLRGYAPGDGLLVDLPELGLHLAKLVVLKRSTDPSTGIVTLTCRSETDAKHAYALGLSGTAPPTPSISGFDPTIVPAPIPESWAAVAMAINDAVTGEIVHVIRINGSTVDNVYAAQVVVTYARVTSVNGEDVEGSPSSETYPASEEQIDLNLPAGRWHVWLRYVTISGAEDVDNTLDLGIITVDGTTSANTAKVGDLTAEQVAAQIAAADAGATAAQQGVADNHAALVQAQADVQAAQADVQTAFGEISQEVLDRAAADASVQTQVTTNAQTINGVSSSLSQEETTRLTADTALGVRIDTNTSSIGTNSASITQEAVTRAANDGALSGRIDTQNSQYGQLSSNLTQEALTRAAADSSLSVFQTTLSARAQPAKNVLKNPGFVQAGAFWNTPSFVSFSGAGSSDPNSPFVAYAPPANAALPAETYLANQIVVANANAPYSLQAVMYSGVTASPRQRVLVEVLWLNASGLEISRAQLVAKENTTFTRYTLENFTAPSGAVSGLVRCNIDCSDSSSPTGGSAAFGRIKLEQNAYCTAYSADNDTPDSFSSLTQEAVTRAAQDSALAATDTTLSAQIGTNASNLTQEAVTRAAQDSTLSGLYTNLNSQVGTNASNITQEAITRAAADGATTTTTNQLTATTGGLTATVGSQGAAISTLQGLLQAYLRLYVAANGNAAAVELIAGNDGSLARLVATAITLSTQSGGQRIDVLKLIGTVAYFAGPVFVGTNMRLDPSVPGLIIDNGSAAIVLGNSFGANGDLFFWAGPSMATGQMTKANARMYFGTDATAFFGGAIRAGTLSNSVQGTSIDPAATTTLGPFGTNGGAITVPWSYSYTRVGNRAGRNTVSGSPSATITLYETITGQAERQVGQLNVSGQATAGYEAENNVTGFTESMSGAATFTDSVGGTQNRTFRIAISNRVQATFNGSAYQGQADGVTQTLSITSSEG